MNQFTTEIVDALVKKQDITEVFRSHLEMAINSLLATELTEFLDYEKYDCIGFNSGNSRNGSYSRTLHTEYGDLTLQIPRDRNGEFKQQTVAPYKRSNDTLEETVIHLFKKGITMAEIAQLIEKMYGHHYTPQTISNMTKAVANVSQWRLADVFIDIASAKGEIPRREFERLLRECEAHNISVVLTKSISRFGRDTVETLSSINRLKAAGVRIIFEKENLDTDEIDSNLMISVMESFAQAKVVRDIFRWYLDGASVLGIIKKLSEAGIPSPDGKEQWNKRAIEKMLENEKYTGTVSLLDSATHEYEFQMKECHPPIITESEFRAVQEEKKKRSNIVTDDDGTRRSSRKYSSKKK